MDETALSTISKPIKEGKYQNIITLAGAGISTSAGIPDFRTPGSGLYHNLQKFKLKDPEAIFEIDYFKKNPRPFLTLAKELIPEKYKPTVCHYFIRLLYEKGLLRRHYTQNIDTLERIAGLPGHKLIEAHGSFASSHCLSCKKEYSFEWMKEHIVQIKVPKCNFCKGLVKPDVVFFGENLPKEFFTKSAIDFPKADLLIIMGSSLVVEPFASLINKVSTKCPRLLINRENVLHKLDRFQLEDPRHTASMFFDPENNPRDVIWLGDCDDGCRMLADELGWGEELTLLASEECRKMEIQN